MLLILIAFAHCGESLVDDFAAGIVLTQLHEKTVEFADPPLCNCEFLPTGFQGAFTLQTEYLLHFWTEVIFVPKNMPDDTPPHMFPDHILQNNGADEVCGTGAGIAPVAGTHEMILPLFKVAGGAVAHLLMAVGAVYQAREQA